jgi:hypothetical protein
MYIIKDMKVVAQNNELKFQRLPKHHPFLKKVWHVDPLTRHL